MSSHLFTVKETANLLKIHEQTVRKYIRNGRIHAFRIGKSQKTPYRITEEELERLKLIAFEEQMNLIKDYS
jgi:excisionase family DNA binding protein